jgi:nitrite reductase (NADH) large subunit
MAGLNREHLVIIGNGMASVRLCEELVGLNALQSLAITVIGFEPVAGYNRVLLSARLAGEASEADIALKPAEWYAQNGIHLKLGCRVDVLDVASKTLMLDSGETLSYDRLVLATGSEPIRLPVPGHDLAGVFTFRDLADMQALANLGPAPRDIAVIGGGLLGLEAAYGLQRAGHRVTLIHLMDRLMERQLDAEAARFLRLAIERKGIEVRLLAKTEAILGKTRVSGVAFKDGSEIAADAVVFSAGIRPNIALARAANLPVERGIIVDDQMRVDHTVYALGECAQHRGTVYGLVEPAYAQAKALARHLCGHKAHYTGSILATNLKVSGIGVFSIGDFEGAAGTASVILKDSHQGQYRKLVFREDILVGAVLVGATLDALWYRDLVLAGEKVGALRADLIFGKAACQPHLSEAA